MNMSPSGTAVLMAMRNELLGHLGREPALKLLDADLRHLFAAWFNRGFLELRRIDWQSPAAVLEKPFRLRRERDLSGGRMTKLGVTTRKCSECTTSGTLSELRPPIEIAAAAAV
jgi:Malonyl-CoA decarboxylase N-terminal domain